MTLEWSPEDGKDVEAVEAQDGAGDRVKILARDGYIEVRAYPSGSEEACVVWLGAQKIAELEKVIASSRR